MTEIVPALSHGDSQSSDGRGVTLALQTGETAISIATISSIPPLPSRNIHLVTTGWLASNQLLLWMASIKGREERTLVKSVFNWMWTPCKFLL